ncbi:hypothetical protein ACT8ZV_13295 [Nocardioides sp. MAHUQ-72]|uniref:hypothetical protein n=1 Tax=unclassified Nocardioides TaxID=2615069 RepID=UPI003611A5B0
MRTLGRVAVALGLLLLGVGTGIASVAVHELSWGLPLVVATTAVTLVALPPGWWLRLPFALGWTGLVGLLVDPRPEGDYVISSDWRGYTLVGLALLVLVVGIATLPRPARGTRPAPARAPGTAAPASLDSAP